MRTVRVLVLSALFAVLIPAGVLAGGLQVSPTRLDVPVDRRSAAVVVRNTGNKSVLLHVESMQWSQHGGEDQYMMSSDLIVWPPVFSLEPGASQTVRVGRRERLLPTEQRAYRVFIQEVPPAAEVAPRALKVVLRIGVPALVTPVGTKPARPRWSLACENGAAPELRIANDGGQALRFDTVSIEAPAATLAEHAVYVLAGQTRSLKLTGLPRSTRNVELQALAGEDRYRASLRCE